MSETTASLRRKIDSAGDLQSVVRTMKAVAASSIGQYEKSVGVLADYYRTVELGLDELLEELNRTSHCLRQSGIAEDLFDLISGFEALNTKDKQCQTIQHFFTMSAH